MKNIMVDVETTGTDAGRHAMIQLSAWRFGLNSGEIDPVPFNMCLHKPAHRSWDEGTRQWWHSDGGRREVLSRIYQNAQRPEVVIPAFVEWCRPQESPIFWSKPSHFDFQFVSGYCTDYGQPMPFHYRSAQDMNSFLRGAHYPNEMPQISVPFHGEAHDALYDTLNQIQVVWAHLEHLKLRSASSSSAIVDDAPKAYILNENDVVPENLLKVN
jgi:hypothetical protein